MTTTISLDLISDRQIEQIWSSESHDIRELGQPNGSWLAFLT